MTQIISFLQYLDVLFLFSENTKGVYNYHPERRPEPDAKILADAHVLISLLLDEPPLS